LLKIKEITFLQKTKKQICNNLDGGCLNIFIDVFLAYSARKKIMEKQFGQKYIEYKKTYRENFPR